MSIGDRARVVCVDLDRIVRVLVVRVAFILLVLWQQIVLVQRALC